MRIIQGHEYQKAGIMEPSLNHAGPDVFIILILSRCFFFHMFSALAGQRNHSDLSRKGTRMYGLLVLLTQQSGGLVVCS